MIRGASVIGREHVRLGKNNQDAWAFAEHRGAQAIVVADGCSSEKHSEVGAKLASRWLAQWVAENGTDVGEQLATRATDALTEWLVSLTKLATARGPDVEQKEQADRALAFIHDSLLFTFLCAVRCGPRALIFGVGDGVVLVDDDVIRLDSGPANAPSYVGYRLTSSGAAPGCDVHFIGEAKRVSVMTDGLAGVASKVPELLGGLGANPLGLQRRLNVFSETERLSDDATIAMLSLEA